MKDRKTPTVSKIVEIGLNYQEFGTRQIMELFDVGRSAAVRIKNEVKAEMLKRKIYTWNPTNINTRLAFELWGFDLESAERAYKKLTQLGLPKRSLDPHTLTDEAAR